MSDTTVLRIAPRHASPTRLAQMVDRHARGRPLRRIEVRYCGQGTVPFPVSPATQTLSTLMREQGQHRVEISIRPLESPVEDALGEHSLRLYFVDESPPQPTHPASALGWRRWLPRWIAWKAGRSALAFASAEPVADGASGAGPASPAPSRADTQQAARLLRAAIAQAVSGRSMWADGQDQPAQPIVRAVHAVVRQHSLHLALQPMLASAATARWMRDQLLDQGSVCADPLTLHYSFEPVEAGRGTLMAGQGDIELHLLQGAAASRHEPMATSAAAWPDAAHRQAASTAMPRTDPETAIDATALPRVVTRPEARLNIRVLGDTRNTYAQPFVCSSALPARLDRAFFQAAGLQPHDPRALRVLSQSCPLIVTREGPTGMRGEASLRQGVDEGRAMYFRADDGSALTGAVALGNGPVLLRVNGPEVLRDPVSGEDLHPLLIELQVVA